MNVTFQQIAALLVACTSLAPYPTATHIHVFVIKLAAVLISIPSHQSAAYGYTGVVEQREVYTLIGEIPWYNFVDPGPLQLGTDGSLGPARQADATAIYDTNRAYKDTENNIRCMVNAVLNHGVPDAYKITSMTTMIEQGRN